MINMTNGIQGTFLLAASLMVLATANAGVAVDTNETREGTYLTCGDSNLPEIKLYVSGSWKASKDNITFRNLEYDRLRNLTILPDTFNAAYFEDDSNDRFKSLRVFSGRWKLCEDALYKGECKNFGTGAFTIEANWLSSVKPIACGGANGSLNIGKQNLPVPGKDEVTDCLDSTMTGQLGNNGSAHLEWSEGKLRLLDNEFDIPIWQSSGAGDRLCFHKDGNLVVWDDSAIAWQSNTILTDIPRPPLRKINILKLDSNCKLKIITRNYTFSGEYTSEVLWKKGGCKG